jgi:hypothetical protein
MIMDKGRLTRFDTYRPPQLTEVAVVEFDNETDSEFDYAHFTSAPGAEVDLTGEAMTGKTGHEKEAFNLDNPVEPLIGLLCKDNDDRNFMLAVGAGIDIVYREGRDKQGNPIRDVQKISGFYDELKSRPLIIGSQPARFGGDLRLVGVLARPCTSEFVLESNVEGPPNKKPNPLAIANTYLLDYLKTHPE